MIEKKQVIKVNTPKGIAKYPWLNTPCTTFNPTGDYKVGLLLQVDSAEAKSLTKQIDEWIEKSYQEAVETVTKAQKDALAAGKGAEAAKKKAEISAIQKAEAPYAIDLDKETGEETGYIEFKFKLNAQYTSKKTGKVITQAPKLFDAVGNPFKDTSIWGGSVIKVNFTPRNYYIPATKLAGVKLVLNAVQVIELVSGSIGTTADSYGFETEEGYVCESQPDETTVQVDARNF